MGYDINFVISKWRKHSNIKENHDKKNRFVRFFEIKKISGV